jgi:hypothetical protein
MQHREIKARAIPTNEFGRVTFNRFEKPRKKRWLWIILLPQALDPKALVIAKDTAYNCDAM